MTITPKSAKEIMKEFEERGARCRWDFDAGPGALEDARDWFRSALDSHLLWVWATEKALENHPMPTVPQYYKELKSLAEKM